MSYRHNLWQGLFDDLRESSMKGQIDTLRERANTAEDKISRQGMDLRMRLEQAIAVIERQALIIQALASICEKQGLFTREQFLKHITDIDALDGRRDGRLPLHTSQPVCAQCGMTNPSIASRCQYCGGTFRHVVTLVDPSKAEDAGRVAHENDQIFGDTEHLEPLNKVNCPACDRISPASRTTCMYCGVPLLHTNGEGRNGSA